MRAQMKRQKPRIFAGRGKTGRTVFRGRKDVGFNAYDIIAVQNGDAGAWRRILGYFMPEIKRLVYRHRPGYTLQDYRDKQRSVEAALLEAVMKFHVRDCEGDVS